MFTDYENKKMEADLDKNGKLIHKARIRIKVNGLTYESKALPGHIVMFRDGSRYRVAEDGSLRKIRGDKDGREF